MNVETAVMAAPPVGAGWVPDRASALAGAAAAVAAVLSRPDEQLDYARAQLAFEQIIDPSVDVHAVMAELDRLTEDARGLAGKSAGEEQTLSALRKLIYESGPWNDERPFSYDLSTSVEDCLPQKLLSVYLSTRLGNCVSMPILFLILGERLGLDLSLANAPEHLFVRYKAPSGNILNLETTSGAHPARLEHFRKEMPMSGLALKNGLYMRSLTRREAIACMAGTVLDPLRQAERYADVIAVTGVILQHSPFDLFAILMRGSAYGHLVRAEFQTKYPTPYLIPPLLRPRYLELERRNLAAFETAEALGWKEPD